MTVKSSQIFLPISSYFSENGVCKATPQTHWILDNITDLQKMQKCWRQVFIK